MKKSASNVLLWNIVVRRGIMAANMGANFAGATATFVILVAAAVNTTLQNCKISWNIIKKYFKGYIALSNIIKCSKKQNKL